MSEGLDDRVNVTLAEVQTQACHQVYSASTKTGSNVGLMPCSRSYLLTSYSRKARSSRCRLVRRSLSGRTMYDSASSFMHSYSARVTGVSGSTRITPPTRMPTHRDHPGPLAPWRLPCAAAR